MKTLIILLLAASSLYAADVRTVSVDIRIVGTEHVDLSSIHKWIDGGRKGDRPMTHWKFVTIETLQQTAPWLTGYVQIDRQEHKTVYLKNLPREITKNLNDVRAFEAQAKTLTDEIASDTKRLVEEDAVEAKPKSQFARQREQFRAKLKTKQNDLKRLKGQLQKLESKGGIETSDFAMFTGQVYNKMEVWDFGVKQ